MSNLNNFDVYSCDDVLDISKKDKIILPIKEEGEIIYCDQCNYQTGSKGDLRSTANPDMKVSRMLVGNVNINQRIEAV